MKKYHAILVKEFLQVIRDLPGLGLLFLMPALLMLVITLTQEKVLLGMDSKASIVLVNNDRSALGDSIENRLRRQPNIDLHMFATEEEAENKVYRGKFQVVVIVPDSATEKLQMLARRHATDTSETAKSEMMTGIRLLFDPAIMKLYKDIMGYSLYMIIESSAVDIYSGAFMEALQAHISEQFDSFRKDLVPAGFENELPDFPGREEVIFSIRSGIEELSRDSTVIRLPTRYSGMEEPVSIEEGVAGGREFVLEYNIVRNNVPAFILFAMFFIVIPLAGSILNEKQQGTRDRLMTLPVNWVMLFSGKITVYLVVCILQFIMMVLIGRYLIPLICTLPPLSLEVNFTALTAIAIASGLAAIGFGLLIGSFSSTFQQAAPIGAVLVVILAVLGGIFVPNYMMPDLISKISFISPLRWGADAFYSVFARNAGIDMVFGQFMSLLVFFILTLLLSFGAISKKS
jgi:ABC-2 type transport system permease protein